MFKMVDLIMYHKLVEGRWIERTPEEMKKISVRKNYVLAEPQRINYEERRQNE